MAGLERHRGHFYNWYDTRTLQPLHTRLCLHGGQRQPRGPSADLAAGLLELLDHPILEPRWLHGLGDTLGILAEVVERLERTLQSLARLERFRGHFYNWYETRDLRALEPRYVSTVDSGNLAGALVALATACRELMEQPVVAETEARRGIDDALLLAGDAMRRLTGDRRTQLVTRVQIDEAMAAMAAALDRTPGSPEGWAEYVQRLRPIAENLVDVARRSR